MKEAEPDKEPINEIDRKRPLQLTEENIRKHFTLAPCCNPIPGDDVLGYMDENNRIFIHKRQCPVATKLKSSYGNRILAAEWCTHKDMYFMASIEFKGIDCLGLLNEVTQVISRQLNVNIHKLNIEVNEGIFEGKVQLFVHDADDVKTICNDLRKIKNVQTVTRMS